MSEVSRIQFKPKPQIVLADGKTTQEGEIAGLGELEVSIAGNKIKAGLAKALQVQVSPPPEPVEIKATFVAASDKKEIGRYELVIPILDSPHSIPDPGSVVISPPSFNDDRMIRRLPAPFAGVVPGGCGRYLIFHLPKLRKLAIFDVNEARVTGYIPLPDGGIHFAAGLEKLVVASVEKRTLERWNLKTLEHEATVEVDRPIRFLAMGHASNGPLVVSGGFYNLETLRPTSPPLSAEMKSFPAASADGTVFAEFYTDSRAGGTSAMWVMEGNELKHYRTGELGHVLPGPDGKTVFTARGITNIQFKQSPEDAKYGYCIPALRGNLFLSLISAQPGKSGGGYSIHVLGQPAPIATVRDANHGLVVVPQDFPGRDASKRIFFIPQANTIVLLPPTDDQLVLIKIDIDEILEKSGVDYLLVTSQPPQAARRGETFSYPISVKAKHKNVKYRLDAGPKGMEVSREGVVSWKVPADAMEGDQEVILTITDGKGQEVFHTFTLRVARADPGAGNQPNPK